MELAASFRHCRRPESPVVAETRFWQWNNYTPSVRTNAAMRDTEWKPLVHAIDETVDLLPSNRRWLPVATYGPEHFLMQGIITEPLPEFDEVTPRDPQESTDLSTKHPERTKRMQRGLEVVPGGGVRSQKRQRRCLRSFYIVKIRFESRIY